MGLGSTAKKVQKLADKAEQLYAQLQDVRERMSGLEESAKNTEQRVERIERELENQHALLVALAEQQGLDPDRVIAESAITEVEEGDDVGAEVDGAEDDGDAGDGGEANSAGTDER
jgi:septal ring factor EnvC (AmiA/AmiB activator)